VFSKLKQLLKNLSGRLKVQWLILPIYRDTKILFQHSAYYFVNKTNASFSNQLRFLPGDYWPNPVLVDLPSIYYFKDRVPAEVCFWGEIQTPLSLITDGDWDLRIDESLIEPPDAMIGFRTMYEMFVDHIPIEGTTQYSHICATLIDNNQAYSHEGEVVSNIEEAVAYLKRYEILFDDIRNNGYKSQQELGNYPVRYEINVCIGRAGQIIYLAHGTHRLAIAQILGLKSIPVIVRTVHRNWAEGCFNKYGSDVFNAICTGIRELKNPDVDSAVPEVL